MAIATRLMRYLELGPNRHRDEDAEAELGLLAPSPRVAQTKQLHGAAQLPSELLATIFSQVPSFEDKRTLPHVCRRWRDVCYTPAVFQQVFGTRALQYVAGQSLYSPRISTMLRDRGQSAHTLNLWPLMKALNQVDDVGLFEMVQATTAYKQATLLQERRPRDVDALRRVESRYRQIVADRPQVCLHVFTTFGKWLTIPLSCTWTVLQAQVPSLRHAVGFSPFLTCLSIMFGGPIIATGVSACIAGIVYGVDCMAARHGLAAEMFIPAPEAGHIEPPAFYEVAEEAYRNTWETT